MKPIQPDRPRRRPTRRRFLRVAALTPAVAVLPAVLAAAGGKKRIGLVDYDLDNYHARVYLEAVRETLSDREFIVAGGTAIKADESRAWARKNGVPYFESVKELAEAVDYFAILAPANPEVHLELCRKVFPFSKTTYVDKTFAPDHATAEKIFALADEHQLAIQTSSALRYTDVQKYVAQAGRDRVRHMVAWGGGSNYNEYAIHPIEMVVSCLGHEATGLMRRGTEPESQLLLNFSRGRTAIVNVYTKARTPSAASVTTDQATEYVVVDHSSLFVDAAAAMLDFFESGEAHVDRRESMAIMKILDASKDRRALEGFIKI